MTAIQWVCFGAILLLPVIGVWGASVTAAAGRPWKFNGFFVGFVMLIVQPTAAIVWAVTS